MLNIYQLMPSIEAEEIYYIQGLVGDLNDEEIRQFATLYNARRKSPQVIILLALIGFLGVAGVHRFVLDQIGMGLLYVFTAGLCFIGTIVDLINYKRLTFEYNQKVARQAYSIIKGSGINV